MVTIIHGEDTSASRNFLLQAKQKSNNPVTLDGAKMQLSDLAQVLEGTSLFEEQKDLFIEDFFSKRKGKDFDDIVAYITDHEKESNIYFWEGKKITAKQSGTFKKAAVQEFKLPQVLFSFLDSIGGKNEYAIAQFHAALQGSEPELLFFMLTRHFRVLLALSDNSHGATIDEVSRMAPWQKGKLQKQARLFDAKRLQELYRKLLEMDMNMKTGGSILNLTQAIDFFLLDL